MSITIADGEMRSRIVSLTSASWRTTSACCSRRCAFTVSQSGSPGPAPTRKTLFIVRSCFPHPCAAKVFVDIRTGNAVKHVATSLRIKGMSKKNSTHISEPVQPVGVRGVEPLLEFLTNALCECRTMASGGYGDLQIASLHNGRIVKVATVRLVHGVAED